MPRGIGSSTRGPRRTKFTFVEAPPKSSMRRKSPDSAPRLYEWLVEEGYVEPVASSKRASRAKRRSRRRT